MITFHITMHFDRMIALAIPAKECPMPNALALDFITPMAKWILIGGNWRFSEVKISVFFEECQANFSFPGYGADK